MIDEQNQTDVIVAGAIVGLSACALAKRGAVQVFDRGRAGVKRLRRGGILATSRNAVPASLPRSQGARPSHPR
jgi:hypothetical protein